MKNSYSSWRTLAPIFEANGEIDKAIDLLAGASEFGDIEALVALAKVYWMKRRFDAATTCINRAEEKVKADDFETHWQLHLAYSLGVGEIGRFERQRRAFLHLCVAADLDQHPALLMSVGGHYRDGLNGVQKDLDEAEVWLSKAAATGDKDAISVFKSFLKKLKRKENKPDRSL